MGRPLKQIDQGVLEGMASVGASNCEIAAYFGVNEGTLRKRFSEVLAKRRSGRKIKLRRLLDEQAAGGNIAAIIFLAKAELGMKEGGQEGGGAAAAKVYVNVRVDDV